MLKSESRYRFTYSLVKLGYKCSLIAAEGRFGAKVSIHWLPTEIKAHA